MSSSAQKCPWQTLRKAVLSILNLNRLVQGKSGDKRMETTHLSGAEDSFDPLERKVLKEEEIRVKETDTAGISDSSKHSFDVEAGENHGDNLSYSVTRKDLRELLLCKDGEYGLEALAMAGIHYNPDVLYLLVYTFG